MLEHGWKEKISKVNQDIALQSHRILKIFVWYGGEGGARTFLSPYQCLRNFATLWSNIFARFGQYITFKLCKFSNFKVLFPAVSMDFWSLSKLNKEKGLLRLHVKNNIYMLTTASLKWGLGAWSIQGLQQLAATTHMRTRFQNTHLG